MNTCDVQLHVFDARHLTVDEGLLSDREKSEFGKLIHPEDRWRRMAFRCELRRKLAELTGVDPADMGFEKNEHGKPSLPGGPFFNLAHAGDLGVLAICRDAPVGVDVEPASRGKEIIDCLETIAHPGEAAELRKRAPAELGHDLIRLWVAKEAALKAMGTGLSVEPSEFSVLRQSAGGARVAWENAGRIDADEVHIAELRLEECPGMEIAVALLGVRPLVKIGKPTMEGLVPA